MDIQKYKYEYNDYLKRIESRKGVKEFAAYMEKHGYFIAPASTKYHMCMESGLLIHSLNVCRLALQLKKEILPDIPDEPVILCALFHDAHKITDGFENTTYQKNNTATANRQPYFWNKNQLSFSGAHKSALLISKFIDLTKDEIQAIAYHDGPYVPSWEDIKYDAYPLTLLLHFADLWSTWVVERNKQRKFDTKTFLKDR